MNLSLKFEGLDPRINISWTDLRRIEEMAQSIFPKLQVIVELEFSYANSFSVDPYKEVVYPKNPVKVRLAPTMNVLRDQVNPQYTSIVKKLVIMIVQFLALSDPMNDSSVQPSYFPPSDIQISAGFGMSKYVNGEPDPYL